MPLTTATVYRQTKPLALTLLVMKREDIDTIMGLNLKRLRIKASLTQEALAELIDVSQGLIPRWESGIKGIGKEVLIKLCKALNVQPYEFYIDESTPLPATDLERKALFMARAAESSRLDYIAEEIIEYGSQRIERVKKEQKKAGIAQSRAVKYKAGSG